MATEKKKKEKPIFLLRTPTGVVIKRFADGKWEVFVPKKKAAVAEALEVVHYNDKSNMFGKLIDEWRHSGERDDYYDVDHGFFDGIMRVAFINGPHVERRPDDKRLTIDDETKAKVWQLNHAGV